MSNRPDRKIPENRADRVTRTPIGSRNRLTFDKKLQEEGYVYRIVNDVDERLNRFLEAGYEFVIGKSNLGDERVAEGGSIDSRISKPVGGGTRGYLMRIKQEWYDEDQAAKAKLIDEKENAMKPNKALNQYGEGLTDK